MVLNTKKSYIHTLSLIIFVVVLFVTSFYVLKEMKWYMLCYIHEDGQLVKCADGFVEYQGGRTECIIVSPHVSYSDFVSKLCDELNIYRNSIKLEFKVKFDPSCLLTLHDDATIL